QVFPAFWMTFREYRQRSRLPLLVVTRCEIVDGEPPAVRLEGRLTTLKGRFFPRGAESATATVEASTDGFVVTSAGHALRSSRIGAAGVGPLEHDPAYAQSMYVGCVSLGSIAFYVFSQGWITPGMLAALLIAMGVGGVVFEINRSYLFV